MSEKNPRKSVILDRIHPSDFLNLNMILYCEQCSHFAAQSETCTIGYDASKHLQQVQFRSYEVTGRVAFCRFAEID